MVRYTTRLFAIALAAFLLVSARPAQGKAKNFLDSDDAKEKDEPQKFLKDYDKLTKGKDADWVYFPNGSLKGFKTVTVKEFEENGKGREARDAAREGKDYMEQWLEKQGFKVVKSGGELVIEGNVFNAWEPHGAGRYWGGWMANPGVGLEILAKDSKGNIVGELRHKAKGTTIRDAVENGLEEVAKAFVDGR
ncbi:MAG TPA: hypothetical protein VER78_01665 [Thermoanaerobaculia bacterium]|nr:hypothetical protein [Thermoanaerobaculia bacterium]